MMFFDTTIQVVSMDVGSAIPEEGEEGTPHLVLAMITGITVPGPQGRSVLPVGIVRIPLGKELAVEKAKEILEAAEALPDPKPDSGLAVVSNMEQAKQVADLDRQVRGAA